jgi:NAD(P)-dependent dehydrogenase (short-subunit alcohol dehydrogenase family)
MQVEVVACDITDRAALASVIAFAKTTLPPIKGILHAAAHFDDGLISGLDQSRLNDVLNPKMTGAWNLHELSRDLALDYFVLYSSFTTAIGNPGQANYVAANSGLEGLAHMRQAQGLPATCIAWGPIADVGYLERNPEVRNNLAERLGDQPLTADAALKQLEVLLTRTEPVTIVADFDWAKLSRLLPSASADRFTFLNAEIAKNGMAATEFDLRTLIHGKTPEEVEAIIADLVQNEVAQMLSMNPERIDRNRALHDIGMDSLMAV